MARRRQPAARAVPRDPEGDAQARGMSFVISLWAEGPKTGGEPQWRWRVVRVDTGERRYFHRLRDLLGYVGAESGLDPPR